MLVPVPNLKEGELDWGNADLLSECRQKAYAKVLKIETLADFKEHLIFEKIYTPADFKNDFNSMYGATFGLRPTLLQSNYWRPQPKAIHYQNLYFTGASAHPGAGVPIVLTSAKLAVAEIVRDFR